MSEFASTTMLRILHAGIQALELHVPSTANALQHKGAKVDIQQKRQLITEVIEQGGLACLPLLGRGV